MKHTGRITYTLLLICLLLLLLSCAKGEENIAEETPEVSSSERTLLNPVDIENLGSPDSEGRVYPDKIAVELLDPASEITSVSGMVYHDGYLLVSDALAHCLYQLDLEGKILQKIGKLGSGPLEFSSPGEIKWNEIKQQFFVVDEGNKRVQFLSETLDYVDEIDVASFTFEGYGELFSCAMDKEENFYFTYKQTNLIDMMIHCLTKEGEHLKGKEYFLGRLIEKDGDVYALESYVHANIDEEIWKADYYPGQTYFYKLHLDTREKIADFPYLYSPVDLLWLGEEPYFISSTWNSVDQLKLEKMKFTYVRSLSAQLTFPKMGVQFGYTLTTDGKTIFVAEKTDGKIYLMEP